MGLFSRNKKEKIQSWAINKRKGTVELEEKYIKLIIQAPKKRTNYFL